jgi:CBS domain containing-hemolysin-like protein
LDDPSLQSYFPIGAAIVLGALFAAWESALDSLTEVRLQAVRDDRGPYSAVAERALRYRHVIRSRLLAGRILSVAVAVALATRWALSMDGIEAVLGAGLATGLVYAILAEVAITGAERRGPFFGLALLRFLRPLEILCAPFAWPLTAVERMTQRVVPEARDADAERMTELAVEHMIEQGEETGSIAEDHAELLRSVLEFKNTVAREVMVPRIQTVAFDASTPIEEVLERIIESGHSRYPVYRGRVDQVESVLYAKDLFRALRDDELKTVSLADVVRTSVFFVSEDQKIGSLLREMQSRRFHLAVVVDEFGGTSGIVTLEDILEEIVGEIQDEHDEEESRVERLGEGRYLVDAGLSVSDLEDAIDDRVAKQEGDYESVGGMVVELAGGVPESGQKVEGPYHDFLVREADERHVTRVELIKREGDVQAAE